MSYFQGLIVQPDCLRCPLRFDTKVLPDGPVPAKIAFVGEGPGRVEVREGKGFVGPSGKLLWMLAKAGGIERENVWVTNAELCYPRDVTLSTGVRLHKEHVVKIAADCCRRRLIGELLCLSQGNPNFVVVPLGNISLRALNPLRKNMKIFGYRGSVLKVDLNMLWEEVNFGR
jgi:uracil-DNA glycosylase family 4